MKPADVRAMSDEDLAQKLKDTRAELFNLRFRLATGQLDNTASITAVKKDMARLQTELRARELGVQREAS